MKAVLAIDPGFTGALVCLDREGNFSFYEMPVITVGKEKEIDFEKVCTLLDSFLDDVHILLERAKPMAMGAKHAFNYGRGFAALEIAIKLSGKPFTLVEPTKWAKEMHAGISNDLKPKAKSVIAVQRLYKKLLPKIPVSPKAKHLHEGVVDALLMAGYGLRKGL